MNVTAYRRWTATLLVGSMTLAGLTFAPALSTHAATQSARLAAATPTPAAKATGTPKAGTTATPAAKVALAATPTTTNLGGIVTIAGSGFEPNEAITLTISGVTGTAATAKATASGLLPPTGVSIPYSVKPGPVTITATGGTSKRSGTVQITVQALAPSITLSPTTANPGSSVTVSGKGFGRKEQITLSLNGAAVTTSPAVITTTNGAFTASFAVPSTILSGANTVSAIGNQSRVSAVATLTGKLSKSAQYYFAGIPNTATAHSFLQLLNTNDQPASVKLIFYSNNGASSNQTVDVAPHSQKGVSVSGFGLAPGTYGLTVKADRTIQAQVNIDRNGKDGDALLGNTGLGKTWYLAEGYTGLTFHETVSILNPDAAAAAHVQLRILPLGGGPGKTVPVTVSPHSNAVTDINAELRGKSISIIANSDLPVVVERTLTFSSNAYGLTTRAGTNAPATTWLFAEGTTVNRFQTFLTILNPNSTAALVTASFFGRTGGSLGSKTILVPALSRANIKLNDFLSASGIASVVTSDLPVVVERPEYFGSPNAPDIAGSDVFGRNGAGVRWSFPGGNTTPGNSEFLLIYNPSAKTVPITATFYGTGGKTIRKTVYVPPTVRWNIDVGSLAAGISGVHGAVLQSGNGLGFVAEQTVFAQNHSTLRSTQGLAQ